MSMFSGLGNQISGFVAQKMGKGEVPPGTEGVEPAETAIPQENGGGEEGVPPAGGPLGGAMGFAQGLMAKAAAAKDGIKEKAGTLSAGNLQGIGSMAGGVMSQVQGIIPGMRRGEEEVPDPAPQQEGEYQEYQEGGYQEYQEEGGYTE